VLDGSGLHLVLLSLLCQLVGSLHYDVLLRGVDAIRRYWRVVVGLNDGGRHALMSILVRVVVQRNSIRVLLLVVGHGGLHQLSGTVQFGSWLFEGPLSLPDRAALTS
jgi:hypothetical protein